MSEPQKTTFQATGSLTREGAIKALEMLDALHELDMEIKANEESPWFTGMRDYIAKYPTWPPVVDGSIVEPITDERRLLK